MNYITQSIQREPHCEGIWNDRRRLGIELVVGVALALANGRHVTRIFQVSTAITGPFSAPALALDIDLLD